MKKIISLITCCLCLGACGFSARNKANKFTADFSVGKYTSACEDVANKELCTTAITSEQTNDIAKMPLDQSLNAATAMFVDQKFENSNKIFETKSKEIIKQQQQSIATSVGKSAVEILGNASLLGYSSYIMDGIYLSNYQILNLLALQDYQGLRIEINRAYQKQQMAAELLEQQIKKQQKENQEDSQAQENTQRVLGEYADLAKWKGYEDFLNPYTTYLSGLVYLTRATSSSDYETASTYLKRVLGMVQGNSVVKEDLKSAEDAANGQLLPHDATWIIFENGLVANLKEFRIDLPIFLVSKDVQTASLALPRPQEREAAHAFLSINNGNETVNTELLADVDSMFISEFNKRFPGIVTKAIIKLTAQTIAQAAAKKNLGTWGSIGAAVYSVATTSADLRSWYSLPKNVQLAKIRKSGKAQEIELLTNQGQLLGKISIPGTGNHIIYVRIPTAEATPDIALFQLN